ncbi:diguanylate cyclase (GGDEF)-like protein [Actinoalloteichus hoggarensis]|uniref:Phytochrome-like protein cph2 n=1 Tax=Actinoalloteichus hoggarensis TaxID=1470176 RepID=A0A221W314_9PSEU|nr:GGDEF domain-containing protein [Actinoalloteichus hoggarensis]ASO20011.1 Phytochrome-like protein cph2 [Actinoalloteichus hoggarensis]MBB5919279.1 diguanylate cyclase (GGDEF)-like protein [Actinoalloteichus hoggarensis]
MTAPPQNVRFAFQPLVNLATGGIVALEALPRPHGGEMRELFRQAVAARRLTELDVELAVGAASAAAAGGTRLPLHLNVLAGTVAYDQERFDQLDAALAEGGRPTHQVTLEVGAPFYRLDHEALLQGLARLRDRGYRLALDGLGQGDASLQLVTAGAVDMLKLDATLTVDLATVPQRADFLESMALFAERSGVQLVAQGVENEDQLTRLRAGGIALVQGDLIAPASRRPMSQLAVTSVLSELSQIQAPRIAARSAGPRITDFLQPAVPLPTTATAEEVRVVFADHPDSTSVVLLDATGRPHRLVDRNRFLLAVTGPYGHALHARREALRLAEEPKLVGTHNTVVEALDLVADSGPDQMYVDLVVVDEAGRCLGVVRAGDLFRGVAELKVEQAATLNPLTRLPGTDTVAAEIDQRLLDGDAFTVSWLDIDGFKGVNDTVGFAAGDELIRSLGRHLTDLAAGMPGVLVGHVGGDDFLVVCDLDQLMPLGAEVLDARRQAEDVTVSVSLASLVCAPGTVADHYDASRRLSPLKARAKRLLGTSWVVGRSTSDQVDELRGTAPPTAPQGTTRAHPPRRQATG